jgi:hypothetical protein
MVKVKEGSPAQCDGKEKGQLVAGLSILWNVASKEDQQQDDDRDRNSDHPHP